MGGSIVRRGRGPCPGRHLSRRRLQLRFEFEFEFGFLLISYAVRRPNVIIQYILRAQQAKHLAPATPTTRPRSPPSYVDQKRVRAAVGLFHFGFIRICLYMGCVIDLFRLTSPICVPGRPSAPSPLAGFRFLLPLSAHFCNLLNILLRPKAYFCASKRLHTKRTTGRGEKWENETAF